MSQEQLENALREVCDRSGLTNLQIAGTLGALKVGYEMVASDEGDEE